MLFDKLKEQVDKKVQGLLIVEGALSLSSKLTSTLLR